MRMTGSPNLLVKGERQIARSCVKRRSASAQSLSNRQQLRAQEGAGRAQGCAAVPRRRRQRTSPTFTVASASRCHRRCRAAELRDGVRAKPNFAGPTTYHTAEVVFCGVSVVRVDAAA